MNSRAQATNKVSSPTTHSLVTQLKAQGEDYEWYPTTPEIISQVAAHLKHWASVNSYWRRSTTNIMDVGAGDGRVLAALKADLDFPVNCLAIEKSSVLRTAMHKEVTIIGSDFLEQNLIDKNIAVLFANPPYKTYQQWATKIITETTASMVYLVIPNRWDQSTDIAQAMELRGLSADCIDVLESFTFTTADGAERPARCEVDVLCIDMSSHKVEDPFDVWFKAHFEFFDKLDNVTETAGSSYERDILQALSIAGEDTVTTLLKLYQRDLTHLYETLKSMAMVNPQIFRELGITTAGVSELLKSKIEALKGCYWKLLFDRLDKLTDKLTEATRKDLREIMSRVTTVDFTRGNIEAVVQWCVENACLYIDDQLVNFFVSMVDKASVIAYQSNKRVFKDEDWRYQSNWDLKRSLQHYSLDYRIVVDGVGGYNADGWSSDRLSERAYTFIRDMQVVAANLGFAKASDVPEPTQWQPGQKVFIGTIGYDGSETVLAEIKAFKKGTLHVRFNQAFILALNVEFGRLKGWLKTADEAATELDQPVDQVAKYFKSIVSQRITSDNVLRLT